MLPKGKVTFRIIENDDQEFLFQLYAGTRAEEMSYALMSEGDKDHFLRGQFAMQSESYHLNYIGAVHRIIQLDDVDIGRLIVLRTDRLMRIIDLSIHPHWQGRGIGTDILRSLLNEAHGDKVPVRLSTVIGGRAQRLYARHGFRVIETAGHHHEMEWAPQDQRPTS